MERSAIIERREASDLSDNALFALLHFRERIDFFTGGNAVVIDYFRRCSVRWSPGQALSILLVRSGHGALARKLHAWGKSAGYDLKILAIDPSARAVKLARSGRSCPDVVFEAKGLSDPAFLQGQQFDYTVSSGALHFESEAEVGNHLKVINRLAKRGVLVTDFLRDARPYAVFKFLTVFSSDAAVKHDAPLWVARGFTRDELRALADEAGMKYADVGADFYYRFVLAGERGMVPTQEIQPALVPGT